MFSFSPRRTLAHMLMVSKGSEPRNLKSRTVRRTSRNQVRLKTTLPSNITSLRAEM